MSISYFADCTVLVTGASSGIGREFARQLAPVANTVILVARRVDRLEALEIELKVINPDLEVFLRPTDLSQEGDVTRLADWLEESGLRIDCLINNAGLGDQGNFAESDWTRILPMLKVNVLALTYLTHRILPGMLKADSGAILNVSSIAGFLPVPDLAVYAATKAYVTSFTEALRAEVRASNLTVTSLCPGPVPTEFGQVAAGAGKFESPMEAFSVSTQEVVRSALAAISNDRPLVIPGSLVRLSVTALLFVPMFVKRWIFDFRRKTASVASANPAQSTVAGGIPRC